MTDLKSQRTELLRQIQAQGGRAKASKGLQSQLANIESQLRTDRKNNPQGIMSQPPKMKEDKFVGLTPDQGAIVNQTEQGDASLGQYANKQLPQIEQNFSQPFDWNQYQLPEAPNFSGIQRPDQPDWSSVPKGPVQGDFNDWRQQQIDSSYKQFSDRNEPIFKQQMEDLEQERYNKGWSQDTKAYQDKLKLIQQGQNDARNSAMVQAQGIAGQNAGQFADVGFRASDQGMNQTLSRWDVGNQDYSNRFNDELNTYNAGVNVYNNSLGRGQQMRNQPLVDYNQLRAAQSGMGMQNLGFSQQQDLNNQQYQNQLGIIRATPRGGGGGGGGGSNPLWAQYGFSGPMEYDAYQDARGINRAQQMAALQPQPYKPSAYAGLLGGVGQGLATGAAYGLFM